MERPQETEYAAFYTNYVSLTKGSDLNKILDDNLSETNDFFNSISETNAEIKYAEGKWNTKEILQHLLDAERIFTYRALRFARNDATELAGFEENDYAREAETKHLKLGELIEEFIFVRQATKCLFRNFDEEKMTRIGTANKNKMSVRAIGFVIAGHTQHHINVVKERYLPIFEIN